MVVCPLRQVPLFNFITFVLRGISILLPRIEEQFKTIIKPSSQT